MPAEQRIIEMALDGIEEPSTAPPQAQAGAASGGFWLAASLGILALVLIAGFSATAAWSDSGYWAVAIAVAGAIALAGGLRRHVGMPTPIAGGATLAADALGSVFFLAIPGAIFVAGHDGLAYALGLGAGGLLMQLVVAPRFAETGAASLPDLLSKRFPGHLVSTLALVIVTASMVALLAAGLTAAGLTGMRLLGIDFTTATIAAAGAALACFIVRGAGGTSAVNGLIYPLLLAALLVPLTILAAQWYGLPVPQIAYANSLWQLQGIEEGLLTQELADPAFMKPMMTAFLSLTPVNFIGIVLGLAAGIAVLPSLLAAPLASTSARSARHTALWGLGFIALALTLAPAAATFARQSLATLISDRTPIAALPAWIFIYGKLGLVEICGQAATSAAVITQACAALPDASPALRLQDVVVNPDIVMLALPEIIGLNAALTGLIAVAVLGGFLATAHAPLTAIVRALDIDVAGADEEPSRGARLASYAIAAAVIAAAAMLAVVRPAGIVDLATSSAVVAASGLFPAVVAALWWRRANAWGAAAGMLAGVGVLLIYVIGRHAFAVPFFEATSVLSSGGEPSLQYFNELKDAWLAAEPGAAKDAAWTALNSNAQSVADWWGIAGPATVLLVLPAGFLMLVLVSLLTPAPRREETTP